MLLSVCQDLQSEVLYALLVVSHEVVYGRELAFDLGSLESCLKDVTFALVEGASKELNQGSHLHGIQLALGLLAVLLGLLDLK